MLYFSKILESNKLFLLNNELLAFLVSLNYILFFFFNSVNIIYLFVKILKLLI